MSMRAAALLSRFALSRPLSSTVSISSTSHYRTTRLYATSDEKSTNRVTGRARREDVTWKLVRSNKLLEEANEMFNVRNWEEAESRYQACLALRRAYLSTQSEDKHASVLCDPILSLAVAQHNHGNLQEADATYRAGEQYLRSFAPRNDPRVARLLLNHSDLLLSCAKYSEAEERCRDALKLLREVYGDNHELVAVALVNLSSILGSKANYQRDSCDMNQLASEADELLDSAEKILRSSLGNSNPYLEACAVNRSLLAVMRKGTEEDVQRPINEYQAAKDTVLVPEPSTSIPAELLEHVGRQWRQMPPPRVCDPAGMILDGRVLSSSLAEFMKQWQSAGLPMDPALSPAIEGELSIIQRQSETVAEIK